MEPEYKLFHDTHSCTEAIIELLRHAHSSIDIEAFFVLPDSIGRQVLDLLIEKAKHGVKVRIIADAMGSFSLGQSLYLDAFHRAGVHIEFFNSFMPFSVSKKSLWYFRNHRRTIIVDGKHLIVGSMCLGELTREWTETAIQITKSQSVQQAQRAFNHTWTKCRHQTFKIGASTKLSTDSFSYITQAPLQRQRHLYRLLVSYIKEAEQRIILCAPYIVPDRRLVRALKHASARGVEIIILAPEKSDSRLADLARNTYVTKMLHSFFKVHFYPKMIHSKVAIFDDQRAIVGTLNLDNISLRYNYECGIVIDQEQCVKELTEVFEGYLEESNKLTFHRWHARGLWTKILEKLVWPIRKLL